MNPITASVIAFLIGIAMALVVNAFADAVARMKRRARRRVNLDEAQHWERWDA